MRNLRLSQILNKTNSAASKKTVTTAPEKKNAMKDGYGKTFGSIYICFRKGKAYSE